MSKKTKVEPKPRSVLEQRFLAVLDSKASVGIIADEEDLRLMIEALERMGPFNSKARDMADDYRLLLHSAFP